MPGAPLLVLGGGLSALASLLHLAVIVGGPSWYRFVGAGERMVRLAERNDPRAALVTLGIAAILAIWAAYAFSGAGLIGRLPLLRMGLVAISAVYLARGLIVLPMLAFKPETVTPFWWWSSAIVLVYGLCYALGAWAAWPSLGDRP